MATIERVTKADIERRVERLAQRTGIDFGLETWAPGDGKRRYVLTRDGGSREVGHVRGLGAAEFDRALMAYMKGFMDSAIHNRDRLIARGLIDAGTAFDF